MALKEVEGDIWAEHDKGHWVVITTNGTVKANGEAVMGRGTALQCAQKYPQIKRMVGESLKRFGNSVFSFPDMKVFTLPVKHNWWETADLALIQRSLVELIDDSNSMSLAGPIFITRAGCGNGKLKWEIVKPIMESILDNRFVVISPTIEMRNKVSKFS